MTESFMTVAELRARLAELPDEALVLVIADGSGREYTIREIQNAAVHPGDPERKERYGILRVQPS